MNGALRHAFLAAVLATATDSHAQLVNGGFETGDYSGWTVGGTAPSGVDLDGAAIAGTVYADSVVNVRSGDYAAWGAVDYAVPVKHLILTQTVPVDELRVYDVGFWLALGRTSGTQAAAARYRIIVDGVPIAQDSQFTLQPTNDSTGFVLRNRLFATSAGQTSATVMFEVSGYAGGPVGISYDDFHVTLTPACGDGVLNPSEECDDGNVANGDCCSSTCENANESLPCEDGLYCTVDDTCTGGLCVVSPRVCDDGELCTNDSCSDFADACIYREEPMPASSCFEAAKVTLKVTDSADPADDKLLWSWKLGAAFDQAAVGAPTTTSTYALCLYDTIYLASFPYEITEAKIDLEIPPSSTLWNDRDPRGAGYKDKNGTADGIKSLRIKTGDDRTTLKLSASGPNLTLPGAFEDDAYFSHQDDPVTIELRNSAGECWSTEFLLGHVLKSSTEGYTARIR